MATPTTQTKKKTSRAKKITLDEAEKLKQEAVEAAKEEARMEERRRIEQEQARQAMNTPDDAEFEDEYDDEIPIFGTHEGAYYEDTPVGEEPDIFEFGRVLEDQGKDISYYIKKDNAFLCELFTATTMEDLKKKYGGGKYTIAIKNDRGQWIKRKTLRIHGPIEPETETKQEPIIPPQPGMPQIDMNQTFGGMMDFFVRMNEMSQRERQRIERTESKSSDSFNNTLFQVISEQSKSTQAMIMEMQRNNIEMLKAMSENTTRSLEKAEERNREMIREIKESSTKKEEFGLKDMIALMATSENKGMETMKMALDMSESLAELRTPPPSEPVDAKESMMGKLVNAIVPLMTQANKNAQAQAQPGVQQLPQAPGVPQRRAVYPGQFQAPRQAPIYPNARQGGTPQGSGQAGPRSPITGNGVYQETRVQNFKQSPLSSLGLPSFTDKGGNVPTQAPRQGVPPQGVLGPDYESSEAFMERTMKELNEVSGPLSNEEKKVMSEEAKSSVEDFKALMPFIRESDLYKNASKAQQNIVELGLPIIGTYINDVNIKPDEVAHFVLDECQGQGFTAKVVAKEFTFDFLLQIASNFGIGEEKNEWFGEFYETIQEAAGNGAIGEEEPTIS